MTTPAVASPVPKYTYMATDLITGRVLADNIPLNVQSFSMQLSGTGQLTGTLDLQVGPQSLWQRMKGLIGLGQAYSVNQPYVEALECGKSVLWVLQNDSGMSIPVWCGVVWDWPDMTRQNGGPLSISAQTLDSVWSHRIISDTLEYPQVDMFTVFTDLCTYGMTKNSGYISSVSPGAVRSPAELALFAKFGQVASLVLPSALSGIPWTASYTWSDLTQVSDAWSDMTQAGNFDYCFTPGLDSSGNPAVFVTLGYTQLGRAAAESGYSLTYPGNVLDYGYQRTYSQGANYVWATAAPNGSAEQWESVYPYGVDLNHIAEGYPILESTVSWDGSTVTSQGQINAFANGQLPLYSQAMTTPVITLGGGAKPSLTDIVLGDSCMFSATSPLHPPQGPGQEPGLQQLVRITGWTCTPPGPTQPESLQLTTSAVNVT